MVGEGTQGKARSSCGWSSGCAEGGMPGEVKELQRCWRCARELTIPMALVNYILPEDSQGKHTLKIQKDLT